MECGSGYEGSIVRNNDFEMIFIPKMKAGEGWVECRNKTSREMRAEWMKMKSPTVV